MSDSVTSWTVAHQPPLSMEFSRQEYGSGLLLPSPEDLPDPGTEAQVSWVAGRFFTIWATREARSYFFGMADTVNALSRFNWNRGYNFTTFLGRINCLEIIESLIRVVVDYYFSPLLSYSPIRQSNAQQEIQPLKGPHTLGDREC